MDLRIDGSPEARGIRAARSQAAKECALRLEGGQGGGWWVGESDLTAESAKSAEKEDPASHCYAGTSAF